MLTTILLILVIAAVALHLFVTYIVPMFKDRSSLALLCGLIALLAIVLAILVGFHVVVIPSGY